MRATGASITTDTTHYVPDCLARACVLLPGPGQDTGQTHLLRSVTAGGLPYAGGPVEYERVVPACVNLMVARRQFWLGPALAGRTVTFWASTDAAAGDERRAAAIFAVVDATRHAAGIAPDSEEQALRKQVLKLLDEHGQDFALGHAEGQALDLPAALSLAASADLTPA